jgi:polygalacturonase
MEIDAMLQLLYRFGRMVGVLVVAAVCSVAMRAQDARLVREPKLPATCAVVKAELISHDGKLTDAEERGHRDNARIEAAMAACPVGKAVVLRGSGAGKDVFLIAPLKLHAGVTLVVSAEVAVWASRDPREYDVQPGSCGIVAEQRGAGCKPLLLAEDAPSSGLMGEGVIDGRGGAKLFGPDPANAETWWELAHRAKVEDANQAVSRVLVVRRSNDFVLSGVTIRNSPNCHVTVEATDGFTAWGVKLDTPKWARNTDGIDPQAGSKNITIAHSWLRTGDDNISPKSTDATGEVKDITVEDVHFYNGHGFGIGSQTSGGLSHILARDLTIDGSDNGLRIKSDKSRGGLVHDVTYERVCIRNSPNPIVLNPFYTTFEGTKIPVYKDITLKDVHVLGGGVLTMRGLDKEHPLEATFDNVWMDGLNPDDDKAMFATLKLLRATNVVPKGEDVALEIPVYDLRGNGPQPYNCSAKFVPFPEQTKAPVSAGLIPPADKTFYVAADGTGDYYSVQTAVEHVPAEGGLVLVAPGTYRERVWVKQSHVTIASANKDASKTRIVFDLSAGTQKEANSPIPGMATVTVSGDDFHAENITFENDFNRTHEQAYAGSQAQALNVTGDRNVLRNVRILGNQDTLYIGAKGCGQAKTNDCTTTRTYIDHSYIAGNVDFIYGDGVAYFEGCEVHSTAHTGGYLTAQSKHYAGQDSVFVFDHTLLTAEPGVQHVFFGRPWRDLASVVFLHTTLGPHMDAKGWSEWHPGETHRLDTAFYAEFDTHNPDGTAVDVSQRPVQTHQLSAAEAAGYSAVKVLGGWRP